MTRYLPCILLAALIGVAQAQTLGRPPIAISTPDANGNYTITFQPPYVPPPIAVTIAPSAATLDSGASQQFTATAANSNQGVGWSAASGSVDANGLFTAPTVTSSTVVSVTATSVQDPTKFATAAVTVNPPPPPPSQFPTPPVGAIAYSNLQLDPNGSTVNTWHYCNATDNCNAGNSGKTGTFSLTHGVTSPSGMPNSMVVKNQGASFNTLWSHKIPCPPAGCAAITDMIIDKWVEPVSMNSMVALEDDPDMWTGGYEYFPSFQCEFSLGKWRVYNIANQGTGASWTATNYPCPLTQKSTGVAHHMQYHISYDVAAKTYTYKEFYWDGVRVWDLGPTFHAKAGWTSSSMNVENQVDDSGGTTENVVYYGSFNLYVWGKGFGN